MNQFYPLAEQEVIDLYKQGELNTSVALRFYIKVKFAPGWRIILDRDKVMETFGISIHQFRRAIAKLKDEFNIFVKSVKQVVATAVKNVTTNVNRVTSRVNNVTPSANSKPETTNKTKHHSDRPDIRSNIDHISLSNKLGEALQSLPEEEREKFLSFAREQANKLPKPPTLTSAWIAAYFDDLCDRFSEQSKPANTNDQFVEWYDLMRSLGYATGERMENGVRMVETRGGYWATYESRAKSYTLAYLRKCMGGK